MHSAECIAEGLARDDWKNRSAIPIILGGAACGRPRRLEHMRTTSHHSPAPEQLGFLLDELRSAGLTTYAELATALNRQGLHPAHGRWRAHALYLLMRRHRRAHPRAALNVGAALYARRAEEARRAIRRLKRRGLNTQVMIAGALNAQGLTTPGLGRPWTARSVSRVLRDGLRVPKRLGRTRRTAH
jgi:hypothetical protein